jgi:hypothetical protein
MPRKVWIHGEKGTINAGYLGQIPGNRWAIEPGCVWAHEDQH